MSPEEEWLAVDQLLAAQRRAQGLPEHVEDPSILASLARIFAPVLFALEQEHQAELSAPDRAKGQPEG